MTSHFTDDTQRANKYIKRCLASLSIRRIQNQTETKYHYTPIRIGKRTMTIQNAVADVEKLNQPYIAPSN